MRATDFYKAVYTKLTMRGFVSTVTTRGIIVANIYAVCNHNKVTVTIGRTGEQFKTVLDFTAKSETINNASTLTANVMAYLVKQNIKFAKGEIPSVTLTDNELNDIKNGQIKTWQ